MLDGKNASHMSKVAKKLKISQYRVFRAQARLRASVWLFSYSAADKETQSGAADGEVAAASPEASITIHYYSALSVCKCFLTTRDSRPSSLPTSPICGGR